MTSFFDRCIASITSGEHNFSGILLAKPLNSITFITLYLLELISPASGRLIELMCIESLTLDMRTPYCCAIGNLATDSEMMRSHLVSCNAIAATCIFLQSCSNQLQQALVDHGLTLTRDMTRVTAVDEALRDTVLVSTKTACWTLSNLARGSTSAQSLFDAGMTWHRHCLQLITHVVMLCCVTVMLCCFVLYC